MTESGRPWWRRDDISRSAKLAIVFSVTFAAQLVLGAVVVALMWLAGEVDAATRGVAVIAVLMLGFVVAGSATFAIHRELAQDSNTT